MSVLQAQHLCKNYAHLNILKDISFQVKENEIFGIIGADGAGKSTLFRILTTLLLADSGECFVLGFDVKKDFKSIRPLIGYMPGNFSLYMDLSVEENLSFFASIFNTSVQENYELIGAIYESLKPFKNRKTKALSGGMKQKLALCCALIHKPKILFLDEPTTGVDAVSRKEFWDILSKLKSQMSIIVSTPYMDEASLCDRIALIHQGSFLSLSTPQKLCQDFPYELYELKNIPANALKDLRNLKEIRTCFLFGESYHITFLNSHFCPTNTAKQAFLAQKLGAQEIILRPIEPSIEDCFMECLQ